MRGKYDLPGICSFCRSFIQEGYLTDFTIKICGVHMNISISFSYYFAVKFALLYKKVIIITSGIIMQLSIPYMYKKETTSNSFLLL